MTLPTFRVEVGFTGPYAGDYYTIGDAILGTVEGYPIAPDDLWTDITEYVRSWTVRLGASQGVGPGRRYEPGTATIILNDGDRRFDANNLAGPYVSAGVSLIEPMRRVRITAEWGGVAYPIWTGFADDWVPDYVENVWTYCTLTATDGFKVFSSEDRSAAAAGFAGELSGARVSRILNSVSWPVEDRLIDTGLTTLQATALSGPAVSELQLVADTELGDFFIDGMGRAVFQDRQSVLTRPESLTSQATFGDGGYVPMPTYDFESGITGFTATSNASVTTSSTAYTGTGALELTVVGSPSQSYVRPNVRLPVTPGHRYQVTMWVRRSATGTVVAAIDWQNGAGTYLSGGNYPSTVVSAGVWTQITDTATAPAGAATMTWGPTLNLSPATGTVLQVDDVTLVDLDNEIPYADAKLSSFDDVLANRITIGRNGGTPQTVSNTASIARYLVKTYSRTDLLMQTDAVALEYASALLYQHGTAVRRFTELDFRRPSFDVEDVVWPQVLGRQFGDRITVIRRPAGGGEPIQQDAFVRGVTHSVSLDQQWTTSWVLQPADKYSFYTIEHPQLGRIGLNPIAF